MTPDDLCFMPASKLAPLFRGKKLAPVDLCEAVLARVERLEPQLNAFVVWDGDAAMDQARAAEQALTSGQNVGPLTGMPVTIKDLAVTADLPTQRGSMTMKGEVFGA
ncbi:MAG: amidase family protein, partial [Pseudomonadota bacterium]|nr:amidase family protein [Pseudomonadota bacterium]